MKIIKFSIIFLAALCLFSTSFVLEGRHCGTTFGISLGNLFSVVRPQPVRVERRVVVAEPVTVMPVRPCVVAPVSIAGPVLAYPAYPAYSAYPCYEEVYVYPQAPRSGLSLNWQFNFRR